MTKPKPKKPSSTSTVKLNQADGATKEKTKANAVLRPSVNAAVTIEQFSKLFGDFDLSTLVDSLSDQVKATNDGDLQRAEAMLIVQAHTLDAIFNNLARRSALNLGEYLGAAETYMKLALRAQNQCRATLQALGELKNPQPVAFVKQANITSGPQQVNNGQHCAPSTHAHAEKNQNPPNELLEATPNEPMDTRAPSTTSRVNQTVAAVE
jgi:hypothetical protein